MSTDAAHFFSRSYQTARQRFYDALAGAGGVALALPLEAKGPGGEELAIDIGWLGARNPQRVLLHASGLHGVEGFPGSAIQLSLLLDEPPALQPEEAVLFVHALNPYGMAWLRRVNEHNVDLNRNFLAPNEPYTGAPEAYTRLDGFLNPPSPPGFDFFRLRAAALILQHGMPTLKQAVVGGQYAHPRGLFYGGDALQPGPARFQSWLTRALPAASRVLALDVHSGLGASGQDTLLVDADRSAPAFQRLQARFGERVAPWNPEDSVAYAIRGGLPGMIPRALPHAQVDVITQEFGTYPALRVLHALREENRWHHHGDGTLPHPSKTRLLETFSPARIAWRRQIVARGRDLFLQALAFLRSP